MKIDDLHAFNARMMARRAEIEAGFDKALGREFLTRGAALVAATEDPREAAAILRRIADHIDPPAPPAPNGRT